ncbi:MAG TPA: hypothetical protein VLA16_24630 [Ideonella sp.]|nr:hypothetical protein [Ideonella sp.]
MQLAPLGTRNAAASVASGDTVTGTPAPASAAPRRPGPLRGGLRDQGGQLNQQVASAQQAMNYLDQLADQLQGLKLRLSSQLAQLARRQDEAATAADGAAQPGSLQDQMRQLEAHWRARSTQAGGQLDSQLGYSDSAPAQQRFKVRGLNLGALQRSERENLSVAVAGGDGKPKTVSVAVEPRLSRQALVRRFDQALAPAGIRAGTDAGGELLFSVPEPLWPGVQDTLAIKGSGVIFPTGQLHRVKAEAEPPALGPELWRADSTSGLRNSLQQVMVALDRVRAAQDQVSRALTRAVQELTHTNGPENAAWAEAFSEQFANLGEQAGYQSISAVAPALMGISRDRVLAMLSEA